MKKKLSLIIIFLIGIIFIPKNVFALDFTVGDNTYTVSDIETIYDWCFFNYVKDGSNYNYDELLVTSYSCNDGTCASYQCNFGQSYEGQVAVINSNANRIEWVYMNDGCKLAIQLPNTYWFQNTCNDSYVTKDFLFSNLFLSNVDVPIRDTNDTLASYFDGAGTYTYQDIECKYHTSECESGGGSGGDNPEEPEEPTQITTNELYQLGVVGITVVCVLICMLFLKWCFPMKGGRKI